jgi:hypothetical protein
MIRGSSRERQTRAFSKMYRRSHMTNETITTIEMFEVAGKRLEIFEKWGY